MKTLEKSEFNLNPERLLAGIARDKRFGVLFGFIHGSYVYNRNLFICASYKETQYFERKKYTGSYFTLSKLQPDVDIVIVAKDPDTFQFTLTNYLVENKILNVLNYFITINVLTQDTFCRDIYSRKPKALKRIIKFRPIFTFGTVDLLKNLTVNIDNYITEHDYALQEDYDNRKKYLREKIIEEKSSFYIAKKEYKKMFYAYYKYVLLGVSGGFPNERIKIVFPHSMRLKEKVDITKGSLQVLI